MVNNNLPTNTFVNARAEIEKGFASELVSYVVIHKAFTPIDAMDSAPFQLEVGIRSNFGAYVRTDDAFSRSILNQKNGLSLMELPESERQTAIVKRDYDFKHTGMDYGYTSTSLDKADLSRKINRSLKGIPTPSWLQKTWSWLKDFYAEAKPVVQTALSLADVAAMLTTENEG